jgi:AP-3 complex subunit delta
MYGYKFSWASFQVVEVMSSATFKEKTIGYLAASLSFEPDTDVLMLTTNLIKKAAFLSFKLTVGFGVCEDYGD